MTAALVGDTTAVVYAVGFVGCLLVFVVLWARDRARHRLRGDLGVLLTVGAEIAVKAKALPATADAGPIETEAAGWAQNVRQRLGGDGPDVAYFDNDAGLVGFGTSHTNSNVRNFLDRRLNRLGQIVLRLDQ